MVTSQNPKSKSLAPGTHTVRVTASYGTGNILWTQDLDIKVIQVKKAKKPKKSKVKKTPKKRKRVAEKEIPQLVQNPTLNNDTSTSLPIALLALLGGIGPIIAIRKSFKI